MLLAHRPYSMFSVCSLKCTQCACNMCQKSAGSICCLTTCIFRSQFYTYFSTHLCRNISTTLESQWQTVSQSVSQLYAAWPSSVTVCTWIMVGVYVCQQLAADDARCTDQLQRAIHEASVPHVLQWHVHHWHLAPHIACIAVYGYGSAKP